MTDSPEFRITIDQNKYLPDDGREVHAIVSVESTGGPVASAAGGVEAAEVIIIDTSGSMDYPRTKIRSAIAAAQAAVDTLRDGVRFGIVAGTSGARMVYPAGERLVRADATTRRKAKAALGKLTGDGGTAMGAWLRLADRLFTGHPGIRHAILLTDGQNAEAAGELETTLATCAGHFVADCRGVGTDWNVSELRKVASALLGTVLDIPDPKDLVADFRAMTEAAMGKSVADVTLRVWTPQSATLRYVKQVYPTVEDLTGKRTDVDARSGDYPLGAWGAESRDYHICVEVPPGDVGREMRAAWVKLVLGDEELARGNVLAERTHDLALSTRINPKVADYTGQAEAAEDIQEGLRALKEGDADTATARLGRAVALAHRSGNEAMAGLLAKVVDVEDATTGTVRLRRTIDKADEMSLDTRSTKTVRTRRGEPVDARRDETVRTRRDEPVRSPHGGG